MKGLMRIIPVHPQGTMQAGRMVIRMQTMAPDMAPDMKTLIMKALISMAPVMKMPIMKVPVTKVPAMGMMTTVRHLSEKTTLKMRCLRGNEGKNALPKREGLFFKKIPIKILAHAIHSAGKAEM